MLLVFQELKNRFFSGKKILRDSFSHLFPNKYLNLPKKGFEVPLDKWLSMN